MENESNPAGATTAKLTPEQKTILNAVKQAKYTGPQLVTLLEFMSKLELPETVKLLDVLILDYLCTVDSVTEIQLTALAHTFALARTLDSIAKPDQQ